MLTWTVKILKKIDKFKELYEKDIEYQNADKIKNFNFYLKDEIRK
jgi:hypothetical protein